MTQFAYTEKALELQNRFDTTALAAAELLAIVHDALSPGDRAFVGQAEMFWLASVDGKGSPTVSFKGGAKGFELESLSVMPAHHTKTVRLVVANARHSPGYDCALRLDPARFGALLVQARKTLNLFVHMPDDKTLLLPCFDSNGMFFSMGNIATTSHIGMLFMDFITPSRLRVQGDAQLSDDPAIVGLWPGAQFAVKIAITALINNGPRYIPRMQRLEGSRYVPDLKTGAQPIPGWKPIDAIQGELPQRDQNKADTAGGLISMDEWGDRVVKGNRLA